jgi:hypothetical protein
MRFILLLITAFFLLASLPAQAVEWSKLFEVEYLMGDGDNRTSARQAALELLKVKASGEAGTYIQSTTTMHTGSEMTENIQLIGASMVKVSDVKDKLSLNQSGQAVLRVTAKATIDESELVKRVEALQQDKEKARLIKVLQAENNELFLELKKIRNALISNLDASKTAELITQQDNAVRRLTSNSLTVTQVFERGTLLQLASKNTDALSRAKLELDENLFKPLLKTPISAKVESVEEDGKGGYVAMVRLGWGVDAKKFIPTLSRYFKLNKSYSDVYSLSIRAYDNLESKGPDILTENLYRYLTDKGIDVQLKLAGKTLRFPMFYYGDEFSGTCSYFGAIRKNKMEYICLVSQNSSNSEIHSFDKDERTNPIRIQLTRDEAERATSVEASLIMVDTSTQKNTKR